jgi:glutaconate CoA-transferase, subunit B
MAGTECDRMPPLNEDYSPEEMMLCCAARQIRDGETIFVGIGQTILAGLLAKKTHAPQCLLVFESGIVDAPPQKAVLSIADPHLVSGSLMIVEFFDFFTMFLQNGHIDLGFVGGAQVDRFGNVNSTVIGDYSRPKVRFPGGGGAFDMTMAKRTVIMMPQERRRFVDAVDFVTIPGLVIRGKPRRQFGLAGDGPDAVVSTCGIFKFSTDGEMYLASVHPHSSIEEIRRETGWELKLAPSVEKTTPPTASELEALRKLENGSVVK